MAGEQRPDEIPAVKKACACARPAAELLQPEQTPSVAMVCARLAGELQLQPDQMPSADMVCAGPSGELLRYGQMSSADMVCPRLLGELLPVPYQHMPSAREVSARLAAAKKMSFEAEELVRGLLKELSTVVHPLEPSSSSAAEHRAGLLRALQEAQEERRVRALEVDLAYMEAKRMEANLLLEKKNLALREAREMSSQVQQALASMASSLGGLLNQQAFSEQTKPSLGEAGKMKAQLEQVLAAFMTSFIEGSEPSSSRDSASTSRAHFDDAGDAAQ